MGYRKKVYLGPYAECTFQGECPDPYDTIEDALSEIDQEDPGHVYLIPNDVRDGEPDRDVDSNEDFCLDFAGIDQVAEKVWFMNAFANELRKLAEVYESVTVKWGLIQYFR